MNNPTLGTQLAPSQPVANKMKENYPVLIVGSSGSGKSFSARNLPADKTVYLNIERKPLPFSPKFEVLRPSTIFEFDKAFDLALCDSSKEVIVVDSMAKYLELALADAKIKFKGFDIYNWYNDNMANFFRKCNGDYGKIILVLTIDEVVKVEQASGATLGKYRAWCDGKRWEGKVEKEFVCVLFTYTTYDAKTGGKYEFTVNSDGMNSAKSPPGLFPSFRIENDLNYVYQQILKTRN